MVDCVCGVDAVVDGSCWGAEDVGGTNGSRVSSGVGS